MGMDPGGRVRRATRWVQNPAVTTVLTIALVIDIASLPGDPPRSTLIGRLVQNENRTYSPFQVQVYVVLEESEPARVIDPEVDSWDELGQLMDDRPADVVQANYVIHDSLLSGVYAPTIEESRRELRLTTMGGRELAPDVDRHAVRDAVVSYLKSRPLLAEHGRAVEGGDVIRRDVLWFGVLHNAVSLVAAVILVVSLAWIPRTPAWMRERLASRALARGKCPACGYAIAGLERCPECGRGIPAAQETTHPAPTSPV